MVEERLKLESAQMGEAAKKLWVSFAEYLAMEEASQEKHEWLDGVVRAMSGAVPDHGAITASVIRLVGNHLVNRPCRVYTESVRIRVLETGLATYPDASVVCGRRISDPEDKNGVTNPIVLVEVLSPGTEKYDRGEKFEHYRRIPSLREYVLVAHDTKLVEVRRRGDDGTWMSYTARQGETIELVSIGCKLAVDDVYAKAGDEETFG